MSVARSRTRMRLTNRSTFLWTPIADIALNGAELRDAQQDLGN